MSTGNSIPHPCPQTGREKLSFPRLSNSSGETMEFPSLFFYRRRKHLAWQILGEKRISASLLAFLGFIFSFLKLIPSWSLSSSTEEAKAGREFPSPSPPRKSLTGHREEHRQVLGSPILIPAGKNSFKGPKPAGKAIPPLPSVGGREGSCFIAHSKATFSLFPTFLEFPTVPHVYFYTLCA